MTKFNKPKSPLRVGPIRTVAQDAPAIRTFEGGPGYARDAKSELFLLAVTNMVGEDTFYEKAKQRDDRYAALCRTVACEDADWFARFVYWLRHNANMRSASLVAAAHGVHARLAMKVKDGSPLAGIDQGVNRRIVDHALNRADEPGELLAFWTSTFGRNVPKPVKRGIGDATARLYTEYNALKYDTASHGWRFADVLNLCHPATGNNALFKWLVDRRFGNPVSDMGNEWLPMISANVELREKVKINPEVLLNSDNLKHAGMTWEDALSLAGDKVSKKALWHALIPTMGYMALLRNLRNFDEAGVDDAVALFASTRLSNQREVAKSRQLPLRFLSAYRAVSNLRWAYPLEQALQHSLSNIPFLPGRTLILVDTSGSMHSRLSAKSDLMRWDAATIFGLAMAQRCQVADVVSFSSTSRQFPTVAGESLLTSLNRWKQGGFFLNGGTSTSKAVKTHLISQHDRVVILTDEQAGGYGYFGEGEDPGQVVPANVPLYTWNLAGYQAAHMASGHNRFTFGGLSDAAFSLVPLLESQREGVWPWEVSYGNS